MAVDFVATGESGPTSPAPKLGKEREEVRSNWGKGKRNGDCTVVGSRHSGELCLSNYVLKYVSFYDFKITS